MNTLTNLLGLSAIEQAAQGLSFTPREIAQQPETWKETLNLFKQSQKRVCTFLEHVGLRDPLESRPVVLLVGAGTSDYIGQALVLLLRQQWGCEVIACASTDLLPNLDTFIVPDRKYLWISFSRSGDSPEGVAVLEQAIRLHPAIAHLIVTCNADARMIAVSEHARHSCVVVLDDKVNDRGLAMTSSFTNMIVLGQCLAHAWTIAEYELILDRLSRTGEDFLVSAAKLAEHLSHAELSRLCVVGSGSLHAVARESALKVLEMTAGRIKTMSETVLGLRHGPMAALDQATLFVCFVAQEKRSASYARDLLCELGQKRITGKRIAIGPRSERTAIAPDCDCYLELPDDLSDSYRPVVDVLFGQLLGLYCSIAHGLKPDAPSPGGVISRVVQSFSIY